MLNRRNLRIKVMQSLFAFQQCKEANYHLSFEFVQHRFSPDLNSMELQDRDLLSVQRTHARKALAEGFEGEQESVDVEDEAVGKAVSDALVMYRTQCRKDKDFFRDTMVQETELIFGHYISVLSLACALADVAASDKKFSHDNFLHNAWIKALQGSEELKSESRQLHKSWDTRAKQVKIWFRDVVRQDVEYQNYLDRKNLPLSDQKKFANHFLRRILLGKNVINDFFEEGILRWAEDKEIVRGLIEKTIKSYDPEKQGVISLHALSLNWEEDREFVERLYNEAADLGKPYTDLIASNTRNWEVDRLPLTDKVILEMAIAEMMNFPSIPVKVSINEYIELAKNYSTPKSRQFINGILDVIAKELKELGVLKKSGRGLMDNK
jgi:transcription antitermination protein NusB